MSTVSDPRTGRHGFDEFAAIVEDDLLRAAWLITGDPAAATRATEAALGRVLAGWSRHGSDRPVQYAYAQLLREISAGQGTRAVDPQPAQGFSDSLQRRQRATEDAFAKLPAADRRAVVLSRYANLSNQRAAELTGSSPKQVDGRSEAALATLRESSTDFGDLPFDDVPTAAQSADRGRVEELAAVELRLSRRRLVSWSAGAASAVILGAGAWWLRRPVTGRATLDASLVPARARSTGQLFLWLQGRDDAPFGTGSVQTSFLGDRPPSRVTVAARPGAAPTVTLDGRPVALRRTAWGDLSAPLESFRFDSQSPTISMALVVAQVPPDTDASWPVGPSYAGLEGNAVGIELRDHTSYAVATADVSVDEVSGLLWRTARQQVGIKGENAVTEVVDDVLLFVLAKAGVWGAITAEQTLFAQTLEKTDELRWIDAQLTVPGWGFIAILPPGAAQAVVHTDRVYPDARAVVQHIGDTGRAIVLAQTSHDPTPDGATVVDRISWVGSDGKPGGWTRRVERTARTAMTSPLVTARPNARRTRRSAGPI